MNDEVEAWLRQVDECAPDDFSARVLQRIAVLPLPQQSSGWRTLARRVALITTAAFGASQVLAFIFSLWTVTAAAAA